MKAMKNKFEDYCYVCGELVPEERGVAEQMERKPGDAGWGKTKWVVRHTNCQAPKDK
jgi:uncharacterized protein CbrC (UPF0167 family)